MGRDSHRRQGKLDLKSVNFLYIVRAIDLNAEINCAIGGRQVDIASIGVITRAVARVRRAVTE